MKSITSKDGTSIAFDKTGSGPAVILVGGALQYRAADAPTAQLAKLLAAQFTVFHYDRRGRGDSGDTAPYTKEREIEDLRALVTEAGGSAMVFAMSSGGALALDAVAQGVSITKLALYEPPFIVDNSRPPLPADYLAQLKKLIAADRRGDAVELFMTQPVGVPAEYVGPMRNEPFWPAFEAVAPTLVYEATFMGDTMSGQPAPLKRWASVAVPTLVIDGGASAPWVHRAAQALADVIVGAERRTLEGQSHDVAPEVLAPVLGKFFAS